MVSFKVFKGSKDGSIVESETKKPDLSGDQVLVRVTASGLCGTDLHYKTQDMVLGHEGAGVVEAVGPDVKSLKAGERVGWGYEHDSCGLCDKCLSGEETYCPDRQMYGLADLDQGSFASHAIWREAFLFRIPDGLEDKDAAPLMCGGATVWNSFQMYDIPSTATVGVLGVGGLGHLAIQFAAARGCDVAVFSGSERKRDEALKLGASRFYATKGKKELDVEGRLLDVLLVTTSAQPDWSLYLPILNAGATIFPLSVAEGNLEIPYMPLILNGIRIQGSVVAPRHILRSMLDFAARHRIKPVTQTFPLTKDGIEKAIKTLEDGEMKYRGVLLPQRE
jgi:D-arabinose 1-dehydrogenase-like Zn-dependent alcohol dehydrogenase